MLLASLLLLCVNAIEIESTLTKIVVNKTQDGNQTAACLRAEFTAQVTIGANVYQVGALDNSNVDGQSSTCGSFSLKGITAVNKEQNLTQPIDALTMEFKELTLDDKEAWQTMRIALKVGQVEFSNSSLEFINAPLVGKYGQSFLCTAGFDVELTSDEGEKSVIKLGRLQIQPFKVPEDTYANPVICAQDISVVIPAIVGSILGLLVIIVLITYIIGRRRTRIAYQEI
jgi:hypothetical protein